MGPTQGLLWLSLGGPGGKRVTRRVEAARGCELSLEGPRLCQDGDHRVLKVPNAVSSSGDKSWLLPPRGMSLSRRDAYRTQ